MQLPRRLLSFTCLFSFLSFCFLHLSLSSYVKSFSLTPAAPASLSHSSSALPFFSPDCRIDAVLSENYALCMAAAVRRGTSCVLIKNDSTPIQLFVLQRNNHAPCSSLHPAFLGRAIICRRKLKKLFLFKNHLRIVLKS